jgi:hypothetical protein
MKMFKKITLVALVFLAFQTVARAQAYEERLSQVKQVIVNLDLEKCLENLKPRYWNNSNTTWAKCTVADYLSPRKYQVIDSQFFVRTDLGGYFIQAKPLESGFEITVGPEDADGDTYTVEHQNPTMEFYASLLGDAYKLKRIGTNNQLIYYALRIK